MFKNPSSSQVAIGLVIALASLSTIKLSLIAFIMFVVWRLELTLH